MNDVVVEQSGGKNSTNIQNNDMSTNSITVINQGMTYDDTKQMKSLMNDLYNHTLKVTGSFPLVSIDQEGGRVARK